MELELKHLAPYLPYDLKFGKDGQGYHEFIMGGLVNKDVIAKNSMRIYEIRKYKPILIPLSNFKGWIIRDIKIFLGANHNQLMEFLGFMDSEIKLENISLGLYNNICKKHIDFNRLIEKGLAIDINTLKQ